MFWILAVAAALLLLMGWLLPWFIGPVLRRSRASARRTWSAPHRPASATLLTYVIGVAMLILVLSPLVELARAVPAQAAAGRAPTGCGSSQRSPGWC